MDSTSKHSDRPWTLLIAVITVLISVGGAHLTAKWTFEKELQKELDQGQLILNNIVLRYSMSLSELVDKDKGSEFHNKTAKRVYLENLKQIKRDIRWLYENQISINIKHFIVRLIFNEMIITKEIYNLETIPSRNKPDLEVLKSICKFLDEKILKSLSKDQDTLTVTDNVRMICEVNPN